jgi:hexosaminidase
VESKVQLLSKSILNLRVTLFCGASLFLAGGSAFAESGDKALSIIPEPESIERCNGTVAIPSTLPITSTASAARSAEYLRERLQVGAGINVQRRVHVRDGESSFAVRFEVDDEKNESDESYRLTVQSEGILVEATGPRGAFYAVQTLLQLMPPSVFGETPVDPGSVALPCVIITDAPRFEWRGLMLDLSRHFIHKQRILKTIEQMSMHKLNRLHLHLTDDPGWRIEIDGYPKLTDVGAIGNRSDPEAPAAFFNSDDMNEIVQFAATHYITVVPEIDMPGHAGAAARAYPQYFDGNVTFNIGKPETYRFVEDVLDAVIEIFPGEYVHFGGDELRNHNLAELPEVKVLMQTHGFKTIEEVEAYFDRHVAEYLVQKGRTPVAWDEVSSFGLNRKTVVQWWRGRHPEALRNAVSAGHRVILSPADRVYLDYPQALGEPGAPWEGNHNGPNTLELIHTWEPIPTDFTEREESAVLGVEAALWTEFIVSEHYMEFMTFPRLAALSEVAWVQKERRDLAWFTDKLESQFKRYDAMGINYRIPGKDGDPAAINSARYLTN